VCPLLDRSICLVGRLGVVLWVAIGVGIIVVDSTIAAGMIVLDGNSVDRRETPGILD